MPSFREWLTGQGFATRTIGARTTLYRSRLDDWGTWDVPAEVIANWLQRYDGWTRYTYHRHLTSIYDWLVDEGRVDVNPMRAMKAPATPRPRPRPLSEAQLSGVLLVAPPRTRAFLLLGYLAGLRAFEIAKFHGRDIEEDTLRVVGKGGTVDALPTHPVLWELAGGMPRHGYWFVPVRGSSAPHIGSARVTHDVGVLFRSVGIPGATHRARHTYGTTLLRSGANLRVVQELMRHRSLATTALYLGVDEDERTAAIRALLAA